ncbi:MAG: hypothetical protein GX147_02525 [Deltaproteobacteria bacterium]|nr:hypothetical protein [Deltaproteobacteria bacterium]
MEEIHLLRESFDAFQRSSARLEEAYALLQEKIARSGIELEEKNAELTRIIAEREGMKNYLQRILESLTTGVMVTGAHGGIKIANRTARHLLGIGLSEPPGLVSQIFDDADTAESRTGPGRPHRITLHGRELEVYAAAIPAAAGAGGDKVWVIHDITETLRLEKQTRHLEKNTAMLDMAARIAHEVRNPLGSIELFSSLLMRHTREPRQREWLDQIIRSVKKIDHKIDELLQHARTVEPLMEMVNLHEILRDLLLYSDRIADGGHVFLSAEYAVREPLIRGNPAMIRRIFLTTVLNALKSMPEGGHVLIKTEIQDEGGPEPAVQISFSETGMKACGDPMGLFFNSDEEDERLAGLNFALIRKIMDLHQGSLRAENDPGGAVSFSMVFPLAAVRTKVHKTETGGRYDR